MKAKKAISFLLVFLTIFLFAGKAFSEDVQIPEPVGDIYVQDFAHILNDKEKEELQNLGRKVEDQTTAQVVVLTVQTIGDRTIEEYANEAFRQYGIGNSKDNNGVLLVLSMNERKLRIEVGYGLEGRIPDGKAGRILDKYAIPNLKSEQPNIAVVETYRVLVKEVLAEYGKAGDQPREDEGIGIPGWLIFLLVIILVFLDFKFFGGALTYLVLSILSRDDGKGGGGGGRGGGGGSSGGGGASRGW
ncbi:TPM domain-containing protein [Neobacillus sp. 114]|uniref:TPM domain-containing protein n=1 Tax=Neobacillus sp. 114 TaxID=3048535 RepID=UPI001C22F840|nr:TPM domain-containing protein [Neobacillus sp. 114]MBU8918463.1 TPM domain-containing protein [Bacillus sp. FJAT-29953]